MSTSNNQYDRLRQKGLDGQFLWELQHGYELSPRASDGILELVKIVFSQEVDYKSGRYQIWVIAQEEPAGKPVSELKRISIWVTIDAGTEDLEIYQRYGALYLRRMRIFRVTEQIVDGGGVATQEDLAHLFQVDVRTIRRDVAYLRNEGYQVITRGVWCDIGRGLSHRVMIVDKYLQNFSYSEICRQTGHTDKSVKRYVSTFIRVAMLISKGVTNAREIGFYVGISERLAEDYRKLYGDYIVHEVFGPRLEELIAQNLSRSYYAHPKKVLAEVLA
jgi:hypothetical protein